jgi:hypothetical protein
MPRIVRKTGSEYMMDAVHAYLKAGGSEPIDLDELAKFAIKNRLWSEHGDAVLQICKRDFARAFREQYHTDPQGRQVRTYHAAKPKGDEQRSLWADIHTAEPAYMELAFAQRRRQIVGDCTQLKRDVDSYNDNNLHGASYQLELDFAPDVSEREQPTEYQPPRSPK